MDKLESGDRRLKLIAIDKLAWSLYGEESSRFEAALVSALRDIDKSVAIRAARTRGGRGKSDSAISGFEA